MSAQYVRATRALLKRTDRYTEANLMAFFAERYPEIPEVNRLAVVYAATAGAQTAAQLHMLLEEPEQARMKPVEVPRRERRDPCPTGT